MRGNSAGLRGVGGAGNGGESGVGATEGATGDEPLRVTHRWDTNELLNW